MPSKRIDLIQRLLFQSLMCPDCTECRYNHDRNSTEYKNRDITEPDRNIHVQEMLSLSALTKDNRFVETYERLKGRDNITVCTVLDEIESKGIEKGIKKGIKKGREDTLISLVHEGLLDIGIAADKAHMTVEEFEAVMKESYPGCS